MTGKDLFKIGVAVACTVALCVINGPAIGITFGIAWAAGYINGRMK